MTRPSCRCAASISAWAGFCGSTSTTVRTPTRSEPHISLEEVDRDEVVVRIAATPLSESDGPKLADEVLAAIGAVTRPVEDGDERAIDRLPDDDGQPQQRYEG